MPSDEFKRLAAQLASLRSPRSGYERFRAMLGPEQLALCEDDSPQIAAHPGRRGGKTTSILGKSLRQFAKRPGSRVFYFAPTDDQGVGIVWDDLLKYNHKFQLGLEPRKSELAFTQGACRFEIFGFHTQRDVERARGRWADLVIVDEAQLAASWFQYFITDVIQPLLLDYEGQLVLIGTPGPAADGYFFDACHSPDWSNKHHWTCAQNPFFAKRDPLLEARTKHKLKPDDVTYRREWLGEWVIDPDALVYYIPPEALIAKPGPWFSHVYGLDLGWNDHDAISRVSIDHLRGHSVLTHIETKSQQTNHQLFARLRELQVQAPGPVVYDPAGHATKKTIETFKGDAPDMIWIQAEKARKVEFIQNLNDDMREGKHFVDPECDIMVRESRRLRWKRPGVLATDAMHSDPGDSWLYAFRHARNLLRELPAEEQAPKTPLDAEMRRQKDNAARGGTPLHSRAGKQRKEAFS